jgi:membrane protease YdiL (CAAX protease family)
MACFRLRNRDHVRRLIMLKLEWLPLAWLRTGMLVLTLYALFPVLKLSLRKIAARIKLSELHVYYLIIAFWEIVAVAILFCLLKANGISLSDLGLQGGLSLEGVLYAIGGVLVGGLLYPGLQWLMRALGWSMFWQRREDKDWFPRTSDYLTTNRGLITMVIVVVICIPVLEEVIYRGYVQTALLQNLDSVFLAFLFTSLIFTSIHCLSGPGFMLLMFLGSFLMSFVYWRTGSIYPCILMHALNTLMGEIIVPLVEKTGKRG